ncbi:putative fatty acid elongase [Trypanosoma grayi]|uniref:putative fatty acid elongase n=1 Tax=Trypanosoma grayi TaxID=71804 RepID=UPI0004F4A8F6|nr:putative fatty acid elongase [Trypanosoma grayi]KEG07831.1 putative fatty acid elongase [Trypanosoma grayi]
MWSVVPDTVAAAWESVVRVPRDFYGKDARRLLDGAPDYPAHAILLYLLCIFWLPTWMAQREPLRIKYLVAAWNLVLSLISIAGTLVLLPMLWEMLTERGFHKTVCAVPGSVDTATTTTTVAEEGSTSENLLHKDFNGPRAFFMAVFMYAKVPELADTVFLVLQKKPVSFLHWYHHLVTTLYCWHASYVVIPSGVCFAGMNDAVHAVMYLYFCGVVLGWRKLIRPIAPLITLMQVLQMFTGMAITLCIWLQHHLGPAAASTWFYHAISWLLSRMHAMGVADGSGEGPFRMEDYFRGCDTDTTNMRMGLVMYGSYCILFVVLFKQLYMDAPKRQRRRGGEKM